MTMPTSENESGAGEPAAWQERQALRMDRSTGIITQWSGWYECKARGPNDPLAYTNPDDRIPREWRPLFTASQREKLSKLGGAEWVRERIDKAKEPK